MTVVEDQHQSTFASAGKERPIFFGESDFSNLLVKFGREDARVCYVGVDTIDPLFAKAFPDRTFDVGICEQDEMTFATGLAKADLIPVVQGWAPFTPMRNYDQLRTSLARHNANVKIITSASGLVNCSHGATHHDMESLALFRTIPNLVILTAMDGRQFVQAFQAAMKHVGPVVIMGPPMIYAPGSEGMEWPHAAGHTQYIVGGSETLRSGTDACVIAFGPALHYAWKGAVKLEQKGVSVAVLHPYSLKPIDQSAIVRAARSVRAIVAVEEQTIYGGLGSAVAEILAENSIAVRFQRMGIRDQFVEQVGDWTETRQGIGLNADGLARTIARLLESQA